MHPDWDPARVTDRGNDLLLIRLSSPVQTFIEDGDHKVLPACLPWGAAETAYLQESDRTHYIAGWGKDIQGRPRVRGSVIGRTADRPWPVVGDNFDWKLGVPGYTGRPT